MAKLPPDTTVVPERESRPGTPRWVKVFGIIALVLVLVVVVGRVTGRAGPGGHSPTRHTPGGHTAPSSRQQSSGVGRPAIAGEATRRVEVTATDTMTFAPSQITVAAGETVTFVVTNTGRAVHEFTLGDAAMQQEHVQSVAQLGGEQGHSGANSIRLQPGETKQLTWRFGDPGTLEYACHEPGHYEAGMRGQITVS